MLNKSDAVRELVLTGDYKKALSIAKGFQIGITKDDSNKMALAYECLVYPRFYEEIGIDIDKAIDEGKKILEALYGENNQR